MAHQESFLMYKVLGWQPEIGLEEGIRRCM